MNKNDTLHILFNSLNGCLPYEYDTKFIDNETTIVITKEDSDCTMHISHEKNNDEDFIVAVIYDDSAKSYYNPTKGYYEEYETFYWIIEDEQIPLDTILTGIKNRFQ